MMVELLLGRERFSVATILLCQTCEKFSKGIPTHYYNVESEVSSTSFRDFLEAVAGTRIEITTENVSDLSKLSTEFEFSGLEQSMSLFRESANEQIKELRNLILKHDEMIVHYDDALKRLGKDFVELRSELDRLRRPAEIAHEQLSDEVRTLNSDILALKTRTFRPLDSKIIVCFPSLFDDFCQKRLSLLWRGSRDGFKAKDFHDRCDGHSNTLVLILDTTGNIFGGFTPLSWESRIWNGKQGLENNVPKADPSLSSFIFTLHNPHNTPAMKFPLRSTRCEYAILCESTSGPVFGHGRPDIWIDDNCNTGPLNHTKGFGGTYDIENCSRFLSRAGSAQFLTGSDTFTVREIEIFEVVGFE
jgi:hypothetical protein